MSKEIEDLQIRLAFQEETLNQFTVTVVKQQNELDLLREEIKRLKEQLREIESNRADVLQAEPPPPHY